MRHAPGYVRISRLALSTVTNQSQTKKSPRHRLPRLPASHRAHVYCDIASAPIVQHALMYESHVVTGSRCTKMTTQSELLALLKQVLQEGNTFEVIQRGSA